MEPHSETVSPRLITARMQSLGLWMATCAVPVVVILVIGSRIFGLALFLLLVGLGVWRAWLIPRQVRALSFERREHDLIVHRGIMFRRQNIVPYGRMQYVVVESGPITGRLGLASVTMHTASAESIEIPGLPKGDAEVLRDEFAARGESHLAGL